MHGKSYKDAGDDSQTVSITQGHSKDNHPELPQAVISLMTSHKNNLPVWLEVLSGNNSDQKSFANSIKEYRKVLKNKYKIPIDKIPSFTRLKSSGFQYDE